MIDDEMVDTRVPCQRCGLMMDEEDIYIVRRHWDRRHADYMQRWCDNCAERNSVACDHCGEYLAEGYYFSVGDECTTCEECDSDHHCYCDVCEESYCPMNGADHADCEDRYDDSTLHNYSYTPRLQFRGDGKRHLGMELEVGAQVRAAQTIHARWEDLLYCKEDGSVDGFEMVTHPMSWDWINESFPWEVLDVIREAGNAGPNGLHVHISRDAFDGRAHLNAFIHLMYVNADMVKALARRDPSRWGKFEMIPFNDDLYEKSHRSRGRLSERYAAVNTTNDPTIEMRVWASTLDKREIMAALGLVDAACVYTASHQDLEHLDWEHFSGWVFGHGGYPDLVEEMAQRCTPLLENRVDHWQEIAAKKRAQAEEDERYRRSWQQEREERELQRLRTNSIGATPAQAEIYARDYDRDGIMCGCPQCQAAQAWRDLGAEEYTTRYNARLAAWMEDVECAS